MENGYTNDVLKALWRGTGMSAKALAEACGISLPAMYSYLRLGTVPSLETLIKLADYFAVPLDVLVGRCSADTIDRISEDYSEMFSELSRTKYEQYLCSGRTAALKNVKAKSPWPYNMLDELVYGKDSKWEEVLSDEQMEGLDKAMSLLPDREREALLEYYRDGKIYATLANEFGLSREGVRQIVAKGVHHLRHPSRMCYIQHGAQYAEAISDTKRKIESLQMQVDALEKKKAELEKSLHVETVIGKSTSDTPLSKLYLSARSFNALHRRGIATLGQLEEFAASGKLMCLHAFGVKSAREVIDLLIKLRGTDYSDLYWREKK